MNAERLARRDERAPEATVVNLRLVFDEE